MKCGYCGTDFEGKVCPSCGARAQTPTEPTLPPDPPDKSKKMKKKKPFFLRWWFILLVIIGVFIIAGKIGDRINWNDVVLGDRIPTPPSKTGNLYTNSGEKLWVSLDDVSDAQFNRYLEACVEMGFTTDPEKESSFYKAYNAEGFCLDLTHIGDGLTIQLEAPLTMGEITWPNSAAGKLLPVPKSSTGKFSFEYDDSFFVYVGATPKADYDAYVAACSDCGFNVDYSKGDTYYHADNADGWNISLKYEGNSIMSIHIDAPDEAEDTSEQTQPEAEPTEVASEEAQPEAETAAAATEANAASSTNGIRPEFKEAMDAYEAFYDEYCDFMVSYQKNPTDMKLIAQYGQLMTKMAEVNEAFEKWDESELNNEELKYYLEVSNRVMQILVDVTG